MTAYFDRPLPAAVVRRGASLTRFDLDQTTSFRDPPSFVHDWVRFFGSCLRISPLRLRAAVSNGRNRLDSLARLRKD